MDNRGFCDFKLNKAALVGVFLALVMALAPFFAYADNYGDQKSFNIDKSFDTASRTKLSATLVLPGDKLYFYVDNTWWEALSNDKKTAYNAIFRQLDAEFIKKIYPELTSFYGTDVNPNVSRDGKITVLFHPMGKDAGGYINTADGYSKFESITSNEREMVYMNTYFLDSTLIKAYLAHEFTHLITFNQKDRVRDITEDVWLNEARADYASTMLGYDTPYAGSNFEQRVKAYSADSSKSLVEWLKKPANYGAAHLFVQYLVDHYGTKILADSMRSDKVGIDSISYALKKNGNNIDFNQVFRNWLITLTVNDCRLGEQYCYKYGPLVNFRIAPKINYLPTSEQASLSVMYNTSYFAGNWQKIVGGGGDLSLEVTAKPSAQFIVPYLLCDASGGKCTVGELDFDEDGKAVLDVAKFGTQYSALTLIPFAVGKTSSYNNYEASKVTYNFKIAVTAPAVVPSGADDPALIQKLLEQIEYLKNEIARVQALIAARFSQTPAAGSNNQKYSCAAITTDLYFGVENYGQVKCLQEFLKGQGTQIYPQGIVNGSFSIDTRSAVARFQEKYSSSILAPLGLTSGTGYVGGSTRKVINQIIAG